MGVCGLAVDFAAGRAAGLTDFAVLADLAGILATVLVLDCKSAEPDLAALADLVVGLFFGDALLLVFFKLKSLKSLIWLHFTHTTVQLT